MVKLRKYCFVEKGYDIDKHIEEYEDLFPTEFIVEYLDKDTFQWQKETGKKGTYYTPKKEWVDSLTSKIFAEHGYNVDIISFFPAKAWKNGTWRLNGVREGVKSNNYDYNATKRTRSQYYGTAEHEDLHIVDEIVKEHAGIRLELVMGVDDFDDDVVHDKSSKRSKFYNYDDVWEKITPYLKTALTIRRKKGQVVEEKPVVDIPTGSYYKPANFRISELVSPELLSRLGEDKCWQMFDERLLRNLQWLRERFGVTYVNINGRFKYRGFDAGEYRTSGTSQHNHGRAIDCHFKDYTIAEVHDILKTEHINMPEPNIWVEATHNGKSISWLHMDLRYSDKKGIYFFNA